MSATTYWFPQGSGTLLDSWHRLSHLIFTINLYVGNNYYYFTNEEPESQEGYLTWLRSCCYPQDDEFRCSCFKTLGCAGPRSRLIPWKQSPWTQKLWRSLQCRQYRFDPILFPAPPFPASPSFFLWDTTCLPHPTPLLCGLRQNIDTKHSQYILLTFLSIGLWVSWGQRLISLLSSARISEPGRVSKTPKLRKAWKNHEQMTRNELPFQISICTQEFDHRRRGRARYSLDGERK